MKIPKIRLTIFSKLFLAIFTTVAVLAISIILSTRWSFRTNFFDLLHEREMKHVEYFAKRLEETYAFHKNWHFVSDSQRQWRYFIHEGHKSLTELENKKPDEKQFPFPPALLQTRIHGHGKKSRNCQVR